MVIGIGLEQDNAPVYWQCVERDGEARADVMRIGVSDAAPIDAVVLAASGSVGEEDRIVAHSFILSEAGRIVTAQCSNACGNRRYGRAAFVIVWGGRPPPLGTQ